MSTTVTITLEQLVKRRACAAGLRAFDEACPDGTLTYDPTSAEDAARVLAGPLAPFIDWAVGEDLAVPFRITSGDCGTVTAGDYGTATAGDFGTATAGTCGTATAGHKSTVTAGDYGTATAGDFGTATAGDYGTATAGYGGTATAGNYGTATAGYGGTATAGNYGTATAGLGGSIHIYWWDDERRRLATAYVGEDGIKPDVPYRIEVIDGKPVFVEAK